MADLRIGSTDIADVKLGSTDVQQVYRGSELVWQRAVLIWRPTQGPDLFGFGDVGWNRDLDPDIDDVTFGKFFNDTSGRFCFRAPPGNANNSCEGVEPNRQYRLSFTMIAAETSSTFPHEILIATGAADRFGASDWHVNLNRSAIEELDIVQLATGQLERTYSIDFTFPDHFNLGQRGYSIGMSHRTSGNATDQKLTMRFLQLLDIT